MYVNASAGLRVRKSPNLNGDRIGVLDFGTEVIIIKEDHNVIYIDEVEGKWVFIESPIEGWVFSGFLGDAITLSVNGVLEHDYEAVDSGFTDWIEGYINRIRNLKEYFHLSGKYFSINGTDTLLLINLFHRRLSVATDGKNMPNFGSFWFGLVISSVSKRGDDYIFTVDDIVRRTYSAPITTERQFALVRLEDGIYEVNVLSSDASEYLSFLDKKQFRKEETFMDFTPTHFIRYFDIDWGDEGQWVHLYRNEYDENYFNRLGAGTVVEVMEYGNINRNNRRARVRYIRIRSLEYWWLNAENLDYF